MGMTITVIVVIITSCMCMLSCYIECLKYIQSPSDNYRPIFLDVISVDWMLDNQKHLTLRGRYQL
jgi:hypothetical protein